MITVRTGVRHRARRFWREYTRMRTAIFFLIGVVAIVAVGSFVPQDGTSDPNKVQAFVSGNPTLTSVFSAVGLPLTSVFVSPIFYVLLGSLYIALGACVLRRGRALLVRTVRRYPRTPQYWGEIGSWVFHTSLFLLLVAVVWGKATGYQGLVAVVEGQSFTDARAGFDTLQEGLLFNGQHAGFTIGAPANWSQTTKGNQTYLLDPSANANILIDLTPHTYPNDMVQEARYIKSQSLTQNRFPGYSQIGGGLAGIPIRGTSGAYWKFFWNDNGVQQEAIDLLFVLQTPAGTQSYALYMTAPASMWNQMRPVFDEQVETFAPLT